MQTAVTFTAANEWLAYSSTFTLLDGQTPRLAENHMVLSFKGASLYKEGGQ